MINFSPRVLQHVFSYCSKSVCYSCLQICNIWNWCRKHFVLNIPPIKRGQRGWYPAIVVARLSDHLSQSTCMEMLRPKTDEHLKPSVEVHHLVGKLSTAGTLLTEVQRKVPKCPGSFLLINVCNQGMNLCSPCIVRSEDWSYFLGKKDCPNINKPTMRVHFSETDWLSPSEFLHLFFFNHNICFLFKPFSIFYTFNSLLTSSQ